MARTPDRVPGASLEEKLAFSDEGLTADNPGEVVFNSGDFQMRDATGLFNPRTGGSGLSESAHKTVRQLVHLAMEGGPWEGFASGAHRVITGGVFPTLVTWYTATDLVDKIVDLTITYNANKTPATEQWRVYDVDGSTILVTVTDTIAYTGIAETTRTRVIT
jgi:hypothetical protein